MKRNCVVQKRILDYFFGILHLFVYIFVCASIIYVRYTFSVGNVVSLISVLQMVKHLDKLEQLGFSERTPCIRMILEGIRPASSFDSQQLYKKLEDISCGRQDQFKSLAC